MTKNICVVTALLTTGGSDRLLESIYSRFVKRGDKVTIYSVFPPEGMSESMKALQRAGVVIKYPFVFLHGATYKLDRLYQGILTCRILYDHQKTPFDFISGYHFTAYRSLQTLKKKLAIPVYYTEISSPKERAGIKFYRGDINNFDKVFVPSNIIKQELVDYENLKTTCIVVPFFVDIPEPTPPSPTPPTPARIGVIARLSPEKNISLLISALAELKGSNPYVRLVIVGTGELESDLKHQAEFLGVSRSVRFIPSFNKLNDVMDKIDIFALCSDIEGMPLTLIEAMAYGKPIVATNVGSIPEMVISGINGFVVPKGDIKEIVISLRKIMESPQRYNMFSLNSRKNYNLQYNPDVQFKNLARWYYQ